MFSDLRAEIHKAETAAQQSQKPAAQPGAQPAPTQPGGGLFTEADLDATGVKPASGLYKDLKNMTAWDDAAINGIKILVKIRKIQDFPNTEVKINVRPWPDLSRFPVS